MARKSASGVAGQQRPRLVLPADLDRSLRVLDDGELDRLAKAVTEEVRRRGRGLPGGSSAPERKTERPGSARPAKAKPATAGGGASVTPGQERLILAAFEAGLTPAAIAREFRLARATVQQVVATARRGRP
ncbi:MAG: hypothetical protein OXC10_14830 [Rhodospirillaceae bacterium]|nr:hypothetical protein [Rhodospirillaceae bacterium]